MKEEVKPEEAEEEDVKIRLLVEEGPGEEAGPAPAAGGGTRQRVKREREEAGAAEAGPSGGGAMARGPRSAGRGVSRFRGVTKDKSKKAKPWAAKIKVTEDGKQRTINIANYAREEDAARAYDRASIAKLGHAEAKTNFPVAEYRAEWGDLEALGVDGTVARERQRARALAA